MKPNVLFVSLVSCLTAGLLAIACTSETSSTAGPKNQAPSNVVPTADGGDDTDAASGGDASSGGACTGPMFDNTRIPGWPTVPQP